MICDNKESQIYRKINEQCNVLTTVQCTLYMTHVLVIVDLLHLKVYIQTQRQLFVFIVECFMLVLINYFLVLK